MDAGPAPAASSAPSPFDEDMLVPKKSLVDDARFDRGNVVVGNHAALDLVHEGEA